MSKIKRILFALFMFCLSANCYADDYPEKIDGLMNEYMKLDLFSGVVMLAKDGAPVYEKAFGYADWQKQTPNNTKTLFNIGSLNKVFTHSMILQLQNESKLSVNDPLSKYLSIFPDEVGGKITIQMLLDMKAGLGDYLMDPEYNKDPTKYRTVNDYLELIAKEPLLFEPGTDNRYSNSGFAVLGGVIEKVTGKSYTDNLKERFFTPLDMKDIYYKQIGDIIPDCASGTMLDYSGQKHSMPFDASPSPAGGMFTNVDELLKFDNYLRKSNILGGPISRAGGTPVWNAVIIEYENGYTFIAVSNFGLMSEEVEKRVRKILKNEPYDKPDLLPEMKFYKLLKDGGADALEKDFKTILDANHLMFNDMHLNHFGYGLMQNDELDLAIEVFKLNVKLFPDVANVYDSMGEAYMNKGEKDLAIENYKKVIDMDPQNQNAKRMLDKLTK